MQRISTTSKVANLFGAGKDGLRDGNPALGLQSTQLNADWFNSVQEEISTIVEASGQTLDINNRGQMATAIQSGKLITATAGGTANALTASFNPAITTLYDGMPLLVRAALANTTATPTLAVNGLTARSIVKGNNLPLNAGDIAGAGHWLEVNYDAAMGKFVLANPATGLRSKNLLAGTGYKVMDDGLILQWITGATDSGSGEPSHTYSWAMAFPTACLFTMVSTEISVSSGNADCFYQVVTDTATALLTAVTIRRQTPAGSSSTDTTPTIPRIIGIGY